MHVMEELEVIDHVAMEKQLASYDRKLREFMIGLINNTLPNGEISASDASDNIFNEVENKWNKINRTTLLKSLPILLQGSTIEGASLARLADQTVNNLIQMEIDINIIVGIINREQFEACHETVSKNKAFFRYVIQRNLAEDVLLCLNIPKEAEELLVVDYDDPLVCPVQSKRYLSAAMFKNIIQENQPSTNNPLDTVSVGGEEGIFRENLVKDIEGCSAFFRYHTEYYCSEDLKASLTDLVELAKQQILNFNEKLEEFSKVDEKSVKVLPNLIQNEKEMKSEQREIVEEWVRSFLELRELNHSLFKFCLDLKATIKKHFETPINYCIILNPNLHFDIFFGDVITAWQKNKSGVNETLVLIHSICELANRFGSDNLSLINKAYTKYIIFEMNNAITTIQSGLSSILKPKISKEILIDNVPCFYAPFWPAAASTWVSRKRLWPDSNLVRLIEKAGFHIVPKSLPGGDERLEWRLSFSAAETVIAFHRTEKQTYIYFLFKSLFYRYIKIRSNEQKHLNSYICKTTMLWISEKQPELWWEISSPEACVLVLIKFLHEAVKRKYLEHYFIEGWNLFDHYSFSTLKLADDVLSNLEKDIWTTLKNLFADISGRLGIIQASLSVKISNPLDLSVAFVYKQIVSIKLNNVVKGLMRVFFYLTYFKISSFYEEISLAKIQVVSLTEGIDLYKKLVQLGVGDNFPSFIQRSKLKCEEWLLLLSAYDKIVGEFFQGLKSLVLLSCTKCDACDNLIKCESERYSCSKCELDACLKCFSHNKYNSEEIHLHNNKNSILLTECTSQTETDLDLIYKNVHQNTEFDLQESANSRKTLFKGDSEPEDKVMSYIIELCSHLKMIHLNILGVNFNKFDDIIPIAVSDETKVKLIFQEWSRYETKLINVIAKECKLFFEEHPKPVLFIEDVWKKRLVMLSEAKMGVEVINMFCEGNEHQFRLAKCRLSHCLSKFVDPSNDFAYWQNIFELKMNCAKNACYAFLGKSLELIKQCGLEEPGNVMKESDFIKCLKYSFKDGLATVLSNGITESNIIKSEAQESSNVVIEKLKSNYIDFLINLQRKEKNILNTCRMIELFNQIGD